MTCHLKLIFQPRHFISKYHHYFNDDNLNFATLWYQKELRFQAILLQEDCLIIWDTCYIWRKSTSSQGQAFFARFDNIGWNFQTCYHIEPDNEAAVAGSCSCSSRASRARQNRVFAGHYNWSYVVWVWLTRRNAAILDSRLLLHAGGRGARQPTSRLKS